MYIYNIIKYKHLTKNKIMTLLKKILKENDINIKSIMKMDFIKDIKNNKGEPFIVGGSIRDEFLGKDSKDIDLIIRNIELNKLINILLLSFAVYARLVFEIKLTNNFSVSIILLFSS